MSHVRGKGLEGPRRAAILRCGFLRSLGLRFIRHFHFRAVAEGTGWLRDWVEAGGHGSVGGRAVFGATRPRPGYPKGRHGKQLISPRAIDGHGTFGCARALDERYLGPMPLWDPSCIARSRCGATG